MNKKSILILTILLMAVGFAVVTTNLIINGSAIIGNNVNDYDIQFTKAILDGVEDNSLIQESGRKITFGTKKLIKKDDFSELVYEITNNSTQYDAIMSITCTPKGTTIHTNLYTINTSNTPERVIAKRSATGSIKVILDNIVTEEITEEFECTLTVDAEERTSAGVDEPTEYKETNLHGTDPVLTEGLIPVTLASDGTITYANVYQKWYEYGNQEWANAVILIDSPSMTYSVGDTIQEKDIESYFVWIPKYSYELWDYNKTTAHTIPIRFGVSNTSDANEDECTTPGYNEETGIYDGSNVSGSSGNNGNCTAGKYMTHPAFLAFNKTGLWVGKFETGFKKTEGAVNDPDTSTITLAQNAAKQIIIKPSINSWYSITIKNAFNVSYYYNRDLDSHMMKNTEWGCVAYLSHSAYGINRAVAKNEYLFHSPGYMGQSTQFDKGVSASTTGNITGVYDMSGGVSEYMASYTSGNVGQSGFTTDTLNDYNTKYFDIYDPSSWYQTYQYRILGDATGEMGPFSSYKSKWYSGQSQFATSNAPWFARGGYANDHNPSSQFAFYNTDGSSKYPYGFRLMLAL